MQRQDSVELRKATIKSPKLRAIIGSHAEPIDEPPQQMTPLFVSRATPKLNLNTGFPRTPPPSPQRKVKRCCIVM